MPQTTDDPVSRFQELDSEANEAPAESDTVEQPTHQQTICATARSQIPVRVQPEPANRGQGVPWGWQRTTQRLNRGNGQNQSVAVGNRNLHRRDEIPSKSQSVMFLTI